MKFISLHNLRLLTKQARPAAIILIAVIAVLAVASFLCWWNSSWVQSIIAGIISSFIFLGITWLWQWVGKKTKFQHLRNLFGEDIVGNDFFLIYSELKPDNKKVPPSATKKIDTNENKLRLENVVSLSELNAIQHLTKEILQACRNAPQLTSDEKSFEKFDFSFISFGGSFSNQKTVDILNQASIIWNEQKLSRENGEVLFEFDNTAHYGIICKKHPIQFPSRVWISCASLSNDGISASAYFLSKKWQLLEKEYGQNDFLVIIASESGKDESAIIKYQKTL